MERKLRAAFMRIFRNRKKQVDFAGKSLAFVGRTRLCVFTFDVEKWKKAKRKNNNNNNNPNDSYELCQMCHSTV